MKKLLMVLAVFGTFAAQACQIGTTSYDYWEWSDDFGLAWRF